MAYRNETLRIFKYYRARTVFYSITHFSAKIFNSGIVSDCVYEDGAWIADYAKLLNYYITDTSSSEEEDTVD